MGDIDSTELFARCSSKHVWVCTGCGKTSNTKAPTQHSDFGWDASCMLNAVLCHKDKRADEKGVLLWRAVQEVEGE